jgi:hypothetical protein
VQTTLLQLQARHEDWGGARATLAKALKAGNVPRDLHKRRDAVLALAHARDAMAEGKIAEATRDATEANRLVPSLVPAAAMAARLAIAEKKPSVATKILKAAWATDPHPDLAAAFAEIAPGETPNDRLKRFQPLIRQAPGQPGIEAPGGRASDRARGFPGRPPCPRRSGRNPAHGALPHHHGRHRARRRLGGSDRAGLAGAGRDGIARAAMDLRQMRPCPCRVAARLRQLRKLRHAQPGRKRRNRRPRLPGRRRCCRSSSGRSRTRAPRDDVEDADTVDGPEDRTPARRPARRTPGEVVR